MAVWQVLEPPPEPENFSNDHLKRAGHTAVAVGSEILVLGGRKGPTFWDDCLSYDTQQHKWRTLLQSLPFPPRANHQAALVQGRYMWVFGGSDERTVHSDVFYLDVKTHEWTKPAVWGQTQLLQRCAAAVDVHPTNTDILLVFGGYGLPTGTQPVQYSAFNDLVSINTKTYEVALLQPGGKVPAPRCFHSFTSVGTRCWVVGGRIPSAEKLGLGDMMAVYDPTTNSWLDATVHDYRPPDAGAAPCQLSPRSSHKALAVQGQLLVTGGNSTSERNSGLHNSLALWLRELSSSRTHVHVCWEPVQAKLMGGSGAHEPLARSGHGMSLVGSCVHLTLGFVTGKLKAYLPEVLALHLPTSQPQAAAAAHPPASKLKQSDTTHQARTATGVAKDSKGKDGRAVTGTDSSIPGKGAVGVQRDTVHLQPLLLPQPVKGVTAAKQQQGGKLGKRVAEQQDVHNANSSKQQADAGEGLGGGAGSPGWIRKRRRADGDHSPERGPYVHTSCVQYTGLHAADASIADIAAAAALNRPASPLSKPQGRSPAGKQARGPAKTQTAGGPEVIEILDPEPDVKKQSVKQAGPQKHQHQQGQGACPTPQQVQQDVHYRTAHAQPQQQQQPQQQPQQQQQQQQLQQHQEQGGQKDAQDVSGAAQPAGRQHSAPGGYGSAMEPSHTRLSMDMSTSMAQCLMLSELRAELSINKEARRVAEAARQEEAARLQRAEQALAAKDSELQQMRAMLQELQTQSNQSVVQLVQKQTTWMAEKQQLQEQQTTLNHKCRELEASAAARQREADASRAEVHQLSQQVQAAAAERDQLQQLQAHMHMQLEQLQAAHNSVATELARCKDEAKLQQQELAAEQQRCRDAQQRVVELVALVDTAKADVLEANKARSSLSDQVVALQASAAETRLELGTVRADAASARAELARLQAALDAARHEAAAARQEILAVREELTAAQQRHDLVLAAAQQLMQDVDAQRQAAARAGEQARAAFTSQVAKAQQLQATRHNSG